jgi:hypothetical protein
VHRSAEGIHGEERQLKELTVLWAEPSRRAEVMLIDSERCVVMRIR